ncbi:MAG TPA: putative LPS assembly protein LptD, partial [Saprospiraceae bacterium]|nr:putative LPS assembly protein LptD [Saprospiraceae bacterium]
MKSIPAILFNCLFLLGLSGTGLGQIQPIFITTPIDTIPEESETQDSTVRVQEIHVQISPDSLDAKVDYGSVDSNYLDKTERRVHLFGKAYVRYKDMSITADYIVIDLDSSIATAVGRKDSLGKLVGIPEFKMGAEDFKAKKMRYNFRTRIGKVYEAVTQEGELYIHGRETKFVANADTVHHDDILYAKGALITTCTADEPHFGIRASKVKTIPDKLAVIGSSNLEVFGVPTPLWIPFGFYPVTNERRAGLILPRDYERSETQGFGLRDVGYYLPLSENIDLKFLSDIYFNGTYGLGVVSNYDKRYKYRGSVELRFYNTITEPRDSYEKLSSKSFKIVVNHAQSDKANPNQKLGGRIELQSNGYQKTNFNDATSVLTNTYRSAFNYSRQFPGKPYSFSAAFSHSQNTNTHIVTIDAPELNFNLNRIYPFRNRNRIGPEQWYEKIAFQYSGLARTRMTTTDTTLFDKKAWQDYQYGAQHKMSTSLSFNALKYFNITPSMNYGETWFFKTQDNYFHFDPDDPDFVRYDTIRIPDSDTFYLQPDTINYGRVEDTLVSGFQAHRSFSAGISMSTQLFGLIEFHNGWLRGIRHVIKPSVGFSFSPASPSSYYEDVQWSLLYPDSTRQYSRFNGLLFGASPNVKQANINYSITNLFEAKYFSKRDSTDKKLKLFDNINIGGNYNLAADTLKASPIGINGNTRFFKGITTVTVGATYSVYSLNAAGRIYNTTYYKTTGHLLRFDNLRLRFSTRLSYQDIKSIFNPSRSTVSENNTNRPSGPVNVQDEFLNLLNNFTISHDFFVVRTGRVGKDTTMITTNTVNLVGSMRVTPNWSVNFGNIGYDFRAKKVTYPDIGLTRDLHCW